jgi:tetratricopeptide (TPR) repeat protein
MEMHKRVIAFALFVVFTFGFLTDCIAGTSELPNHQGVRSSAPFFNKAGKAIEQLRIGKHEKAWKMISKELKKPSRSSRKDPCYLHAAALQILAEISTMTALRPPDFDQLVQDSYDYIRENCETDAGYLGLAESSYANILGQSGKYGFAIPYFKRAEKLAVTDYERAMCMNNIAICYSHMEDFELCDHYQLKSLELLSQYFKTKRKYKDNMFEAVQRISYSNVLESRLSRLRDHILVGTENKKEGLVKMRKIWGEIENINKKWVSKKTRYVAYANAMKIFASLDKEFARELFVKAEKLSRKYPDKEIAKVDIIECEALLLQLEGKHQEAKAHYNLGIAYRKSGKYQEAIESFKQAIKIDSDYVKAHYNLGIAYLLLWDRDSALEQHKILKKLDTELANELANELFNLIKLEQYKILEKLDTELANGPFDEIYSE